jgi:hypothetical protein
MNRRNISLAVIALGAVFCVWVSYKTSETLGTRGAGGAGFDLMTTIRGFYSFVTLCFGVALGSLYKRLVDMKSQGVARVDHSKLVREVWGSPDFLIGLCTAPAMFGSLWQAVGDMSIAALTMMALQNGFAGHAAGDMLFGKRLSDGQAVKVPTVEDAGHKHT